MDDRAMTTDAPNPSPHQIFTPQTWILICMGLTSAGLYVGNQMAPQRTDYVTRNEYNAAMLTLHEQMVELKTQVGGLDLYVRQNLPGRDAARPR
jgi:hypothetical protein